MTAAASGPRATGLLLAVVSAALVLLMLCGCQPTSGVFHKVRDGQDLRQISRAYGVDEMTLARINGVDSPDAVGVGDTIFIPGARQVVNLPGAAERPAPPRPPASGKDSLKKTAAPAPLLRNPAPREASAAEPPKATRDRFVWPLKGEVVRRYGDRTPTPCKGIEIASPPATPVVAAAAGRVIYSGDGIRSYGNLVIVKHDDGYFTVYGYNRSNLVAAGKFVSRGERIALSGSPPSGAGARLYFEIRYGKEPVDPSFYLP